MKRITCLLLLCSGLFASDSVAQTEEHRRNQIRDYFQSREQFRAPTSGESSQQKSFLFRLHFRTFDGSYNNLIRPEWGKAGVLLSRIARPAYSDGHSQMAGANRNSPRLISNKVCKQKLQHFNHRQLTSMVWQWGQFLDHDIDLTELADPAEPAFINVPFGDPFFDPRNLGGQQIGFFRSDYRIAGRHHRREQTNSITAWIDGSNVYGSDEATARSLREFQGGRLRTSPGNLLPLDQSGFFLAGDVRANEQLGLTAMHTLFMREHNRAAGIIQQRRPHLDDETIFLLARRHVIAVMQSITYHDFLPALLGKGAIAKYSGYKPWISPNITNEFSTAAYRFGHSMLNSELLRLNNDGLPIAAGNIALRNAFFNPQELIDYGIEPYLKGLVEQKAQEIDGHMIDDVRNFLFGAPGSGGFDLAALNIQRGRDHGLPDFNTIRAAVGLPRVATFEQLTSDAQLQSLLKLAYHDDIDDVDPWVGMLAEDHVLGASVGPTVRKVLALQFEAIRDGDRFWYQNRSRSARIMDRPTLSDIIRLNSGVRNIQPNVFFMPDSQP